jgi:antitoxin component of MazEF toxin-antitoxin module
MTLSIRPIRLKKSVYFRVPNDIVDLISLEDDSQVTLTLEERDDRHLLVYSVLKNKPLAPTQKPEA